MVAVEGGKEQTVLLSGLGLGSHSEVGYERHSEVRGWTSGPMRQRGVRLWVDASGWMLGGMGLLEPWVRLDQTLLQEAKRIGNSLKCHGAAAEDIDNITWPLLIPATPFQCHHQNNGLLWLRRLHF